jgi:phosphate transport system substrate-binding protein
MFNNIVLSSSFHCRSTARLFRSLLLPVLLWTSLTPSYAAPASESKLPLGGRVVVTGSVPLANLISLWAEDFSYRNPRVAITVANGGSSVGVEALINGSADSVLIDMPLSRQEEERFMDRFGYAPTLFPVAMDGVVLYVNSLNSLRQISIPQLDAIYSASLRCGADQPFENWGQLGVKGEYSKDPITALGLTASSGAYLLFKHVALCDGDFRANFQALAGPSAVEWALTDNPAAIGFASSARHSTGIRALAIATHRDDEAVSPSIRAIQSGRYPLARRLSIIINIPPGRNAKPAIQAFLDYARSKAGQAVAKKAGYVPLPLH